MATFIETAADQEIAACLAAQQSFALIAGAGSGKTTSLITALDVIRSRYGATLRRNAQHVACITYTNRAVDVIADRLHHDDLFVVKTLHSFLWTEIKGFTRDIREAVTNWCIPQRIERAIADDNGGNSQKARKAREQLAKLQDELATMDEVRSFSYEETKYSRYSNGELSHDDIIDIAGYLLREKPILRKAIGYRYPFLFIDEAQDTFHTIVEGFNLVGGERGLPVVGYFGDPWQQVYDKRAGEFTPPPSGKTITKTENFRCSESVIRLLNAFRKDVTQTAAGKNKGRQGSVTITLIQAEQPAGPRNTYSEDQLERSLKRLDIELARSGWAERDDVTKLFLVRQMIARRLGFPGLHELFTGKYASSRAQDDYEQGEHFLLRPFSTAIWPLVEASKNSSSRQIVDLLRKSGPAFDIDGKNAHRSLRAMTRLAETLIADLREHWESGTTGEVLRFCNEHELVRLPEKLVQALNRERRPEDYDDTTHAEEKGDWLCDEFFTLDTTQVQAYCDFIEKHTTYSTQHGVKGEEYPNVLVVFDDTAARWTNYSFAKLLTPNTSGDPTDGQLERSRKLAYVCFSRATDNLRIVLYTPDPRQAKEELINQGFFTEENIQIADG
jgi:DNA helicase-2/ATP-dependent DNA helicase PcrA